VLSAVETTNCMGMFCNVASTRRGGKKLCKSDNHAQQRRPIADSRHAQMGRESERRVTHHIPFCSASFLSLTRGQLKNGNCGAAKNNGLSSVMHMRRQFFRVLSTSVILYMYCMSQTKGARKSQTHHSFLHFMLVRMRKLVLDGCCCARCSI
jgi:hypothetical protein